MGTGGGKDGRGDEGGWATGTGDYKETTRNGKPTLLYSLSNFVDNH